MGHVTITAGDLASALDTADGVEPYTWVVGDDAEGGEREA
jgi:hypothetical protein